MLGRRGWENELGCSNKVFCVSSFLPRVLSLNIQRKFTELKYQSYSLTTLLLCSQM